MKAIRNPMTGVPALLALVAVLGSGLVSAADTPRPFPDPTGKHEPKLRDKPAHHTHEKANHNRQPSTQPGKTTTVGVVGTIANKPPSCAKGFKATKVNKRSYLCVMSVKPRCDYGRAWPLKWNAAARRIEYVCALPEG